MFVDYPQDQWVDFMAYNIAGAGALAWVFGITYMVATTLTILQLREVNIDILGTFAFAVSDSLCACWY